ncbi:MAG: hypothetical protein PVJ40_01455 [Gammaproteobacteria bacterium]|jgi:hypothetical protein
MKLAILAAATAALTLSGAAAQAARPDVDLVRDSLAAIRHQGHDVLQVTRTAYRKDLARTASRSAAARPGAPALLAEVGRQPARDSD